MTRYLVARTALVLWLLAATRALAAADLLEAIPENALGVAVVNRLDDTNARVQKLTEKMKLPVPDLLTLAQTFTGVQQGLDAKGNLAVAVFPDEHDDATWGMSLAFFVPVSDYKAFVAQLQPADAQAPITEVTVLGGQYLVANKGEFAVLASSSQKYVIEHVLASSKGISGVVEPLRAWLDQQQAAIVVTPSGQKVLLEKLEGFLDSAVQAAETSANQQAKDADAPKDNDGKEDEAAKAAAAAAANLKQVLEIGRVLALAIKTEVTEFGVGVRIDDQTALHLALRAAFTPRGALSQWSAGVKSPEGGLLAGLPPSKFVIVYGAMVPQLHPAVSDLINRLTLKGLEMFGLDQEQQKKYLDTVAAHRANLLRTCGLMGQFRPGDSIMATAMSLEHVKDAKTHLQASRELFEMLKTATAKNDAQKKPIYDVNEVTIGDLKAVEIVTDINAMVGVSAPQPAMADQLQTMFSKLFGKEGVLRVYVAVADDHTVVSAYSKELLQLGVTHVRSGAVGLAADPQIVETNKLLPAGAQWAAYVSPQGFLQWIDVMMRELLPPEVKFRIPPFPASDPIGLAAKVSESGLDAELTLPANVVSGIGQYIGIVQQMLQGGAAPLP